MTNEELLRVIRMAKASGAIELLEVIEDAKASGMTELILRDKQLATLPPEICQLTSLIRLELGANQLTALPPEICQLTSLTTLGLSCNQLNSLPSEICQLTNLTELYLNYNQFATLPPEICQLPNLTKLHLSNNQLAALPPELFQMRNLIQLDLGGLNLTALPPEICQLTNLRWLDLSKNKLTALPPELFQMRTLTGLNLSDNKFTSLPPELFQMRNLIQLDLGGLNLTALPPEICQLTSLGWLNLSKNKLTALPLKIGQLIRLTRLNLSDNKFTSLPPDICQLPNLMELNLDRNPLPSPPLEIAGKGIKAVLQYFAALQQANQPLNQVKVLLVGDGAAGKTSLVKQLLGEAFNQHEDTTHGISIRGWEIDAGGQPIKVNIWDFGGQEIMHATHQFFLSKRSLYVLVLDGRKDERAEYWLQHIESFGGDSPVLVVLNKQDSNPSFDLNRPFLRDKYKGIREFFRTSCADGRGIAEFKEALISELAQVPMIAIRWPKTWFAVKQRIEQMGKPYISCEEYGGLCAEAGLAGDENRETLVDFLHDLGVAVHFKDFILKAMHVLDPVWVTNAVYKIITAEAMADSKGVLHLDCLESILKQHDGEKHCYPAATHVYLLELMKKFELCYSVENQAVLIPQLLPVPEPKFTFDYSGALGFVLHYHSFLPPSVMPRFLVKRHKQIKAGLCWRTGAVLHDQASGTEAAVKADTEARRIHLWVNGPRRKEFLSFLWFTLREINSSFEKLNVSERIPMPDDPTCSADYQTLIDNVKDGIDRYRPDGAKRAYNVKELLGLIEPSRDDEMLALLRMIKAQMDEKESGTEVLNNLFELKPGLFGVSVNLNEAFKQILARQKKK